MGFIMRKCFITICDSSGQPAHSDSLIIAFAVHNLFPYTIGFPGRKDRWLLLNLTDAKADL